MDTINLSDVKKLIATAHATLCILLHALDTKVLVGEINRPSDPVIKIKRKRRTKKEIALTATADHIKMDLEKDYQVGRIPDLMVPGPIVVLPDADKDSTFYGKSKKERKKREKKEPTVE